MRISDWSSDVCSSDLIHEKVSWILNKLAQRQARKEQLAIADTQWRNGGHVPYMGKRIYLDLGNPGSRITLDGTTVAPQDGDTLRMSLPDDADRHRVRDSVHGWLQQQARIWFGLRVDHFQKISGLAVNRWRLSAAATRWGSCNSDGNIMLNWRLIHFDRDIIDYVVVHERSEERRVGEECVRPGSSRWTQYH